MLKVYAINGITPVVDPGAYVHPTAVLIGDVIVGAGVYVGPLASLRGDFGRIELRRGSNVQDACVIHGVAENDTIVEEDGHIGHAAVLHGCTIGRNALVGMNAVVMDQAVVGECSIVAAMAFVKAGMAIPPRSLVVGAPARVLRELSDAEIEQKSYGTRQYQLLTTRSLQTMQVVEPLARVEENRARLSREVTDPAR
ncbi:phenylacetic acid degradation protein PaaY [Parapusillimonas granuli]|uniref:Phenylacetic acid degradation protein PaaY n=1 Tax=Parapusillimonas granuli TaxID=380911 RepID=A0A853FV53_9BURK|nr:phenylacetic acid degradation protein PaaY [Parapusillimonas granuli]MBB5213646.1 phenylacetic acid degradation protein/carnitine operon protein CaiE [Parapusillimonas granuli]NYT48483.1 phenylacetic acid degradation protein PaaY [Parapusillimonas granuli]